MGQNRIHHHAGWDAHLQPKIANAIFTLQHSLIFLVFASLSGFSVFQLSASVSSEVKSLPDQTINQVKWALDYLAIYHPGFENLNIKSNLQNQQIQLTHPNRGNQLILPIDEPLNEREVFKRISSLLLQPERNIVSRTSLTSLETAWFWDAKVRSDAAYFDFLSQLFQNKPEGKQSEDALVFWKFRAQVKQQGGRKKWWAFIAENPTAIEKLAPQAPLEKRTQLELNEMIHYKYSPVWSLETTQFHLQLMESFLLVSPRSQTQWVELKTLPKHCLKDPLIHQEMQRRLAWIKPHLVNCNPLFLNCFQSLGVCFERLIENDSNGFQIAIKRYAEDKDFAIRITKTIQTKRNK